MSKTVENASVGIPQEPKQKQEMLYLLLGTVWEATASVGNVCGSVLTVTLSDGGVMPSLGGEKGKWGRRITLTQITNQAWCRKKKTSP